METLADLRADFEQRTNRSMSLPIAGAIVWSLAAVCGYLLPFKLALLALVFSTGAIFPLALLIARLRKEALVNSTNPLSKLMGLCVLMVNLLWALHIPLLMKAPIFVPLSLGIALGLHWVVYSWIIVHPLGYAHAIVRTLGLVVAWFLFPSNVITACATVVVATYCITLFQMANRPAADSSFKSNLLRDSAGPA